MPARDHVLLTDAERPGLFGMPVSPDELTRRYTLEAADLDLSISGVSIGTGSA